MKTKPKKTNRRSAKKSQPELPRLTATSKIAVLRMNAWGDLIHSLPMLRTLRELAPKSEIVYIGSEWHEAFLPKHVPYVDRVIAIPYEATEMSTWPERRLAKVFSPLAKEHFDVFIQAHDGGTLGDRIVEIVKPKFSVGSSNNPKSPLSIKFHYEPGQHEVNRLLELLTPWKVKSFHMQADIIVTKEDTDDALELLDGLLKDEYIVVHPGAGDMRRQWPVHRFAKLTQWLVDQGHPVVVTGSNAEVPIANELQMLVKDELCVRAGLLTMGNTLAILQNAKLVITSDTGPLHVARALDTKSVGLYTARHYSRTIPFFTQRTRSVVSSITECPSCGGDVFSSVWPSLDQWRSAVEKVPCRHDDSSLLGDISVSDVQKAVESIL